MKSATDLGMNRTGISFSPLHSKELIEGAANAEPSSMGDESNLIALRAQYIKDSDPVGTVPPPATLKGAAATVVNMIKGQKLSVLLDKLGERLAFERTGSRLYETVIGKALTEGSWEGGPSIEELKQIHDDELRHVAMLTEIIVGLGADPTAMTPSADIMGVASMGIIQVCADPRASLAQTLNVMLTTELTDNDGYTVLILLAESLGQQELAEKLRTARSQEDMHLQKVRLWVSNHCVAEGSKELEAKG
ncbi:MAG TPA: ferritin-like domain-containing protein [Polyangiaceae bacterium]|jgi:bacterioferritin (cytochrome b1)|nr:ferritin-like domain-containing protein [Polyangiaceae bacterium]